MYFDKNIRLKKKRKKINRSIGGNLNNYSINRFSQNKSHNICRIFIDYCTTLFDNTSNDHSTFGKSSRT